MKQHQKLAFWQCTREKMKCEGKKKKKNPKHFELKENENIINISNDWRFEFQSNFYQIGLTICLKKTALHLKSVFNSKNWGEKKRKQKLININQISNYNFSSNIEDVKKVSFSNKKIFNQNTFSIQITTPAWILRKSRTWASFEWTAMVGVVGSAI